MSDGNLILKATIEVYSKFPEEDEKWFREQSGPDQAKILAENVKLIKEHLEGEFPRGSEYKIDIQEVPEWPK